MVMPACGTFHYVTTVPARDQWDCWVVEDASGADPATREIDLLQDRRLVGLYPRLTVDGRRLTLDARDLPRASLRAASFELDEDLLDALQPHDRLVLIRTECADLGVAVLRDDALLFAAGALPALPMGASTHAMAVFPPGLDPFAYVKGDVRLSTAGAEDTLPLGQDIEVGQLRACLLKRPDTSIPGTLGIGAVCCDLVSLAAVKRAADRMTYLEMIKFEDVPLHRRLMETCSRIRSLFRS